MSQDVEESSEKCEGMMIHEVHAVPLKGGANIWLRSTRGAARTENSHAA